MTREEAYKILGKRRAKWEYRVMAKALAIHPWLNNEEEWQRCEALRALGYSTAPKRSDWQ